MQLLSGKCCRGLQVPGQVSAWAQQRVQLVTFSRSPTHPPTRTLRRPASRLLLAPPAARPVAGGELPMVGRTMPAAPASATGGATPAASAAVDVKLVATSGITAAGVGSACAKMMQLCGRRQGTSNRWWQRWRHQPASSSAMLAAPTLDAAHLQMRTPYAAAALEQAQQRRSHLKCCLKSPQMGWGSLLLQIGSHSFRRV